MKRFAVGGVAIDLDGTLLDTAPDIATAVNAMRADHGQSPLPLERIAAYVGKGAEVLVHRAMTDDPDGRLDASRFEPAIAAFRRHYTASNGLMARCYPGVINGLDRIRSLGLRCAVVTNKPGAFTGPLLARTGLADYFDLVVSGDTLPRRKPDPLPMRHVCARFGLPPESVIVIGDSVNDALSARAAGMPVLLVPYGYSEGIDVRTLDVDAIVDSIQQAALLLDPI